MGIKRKLRRILGLFGLYRRSNVLAFFVDYTRAAKRLRLEPKEAADEAHRAGTWNFDNPLEREWQQHVLATVSAQTGTARWGDVLEVGCSEGVFTAQLAARCNSVTAYDISPVAAARAAERCQPCGNVRICQVDVATQEIEGQYDMVFVMDILWLVVGKERKASIVPKLVHALRDGGLLIFSDSRMPKSIRHPFWSLFFPSGADEWAKRLERAGGLAVARKECYPAHGRSIPEFWAKLFVLFRKQPASGA
ncbi:MAG TPA: SAM-dependent methyltransferase [Acidobacteriaceae bacterium]